MVRCVLGIGSNMDPIHHIQIAVRSLSRTLKVPFLFSRAYRCPAEEFIGNDFVNLAVLFETSLSLPELQDTIKGCEQKIESHRSPLENRKIDLDLLLYGDHKDDHRDIPRNDLLRFAFSACCVADLIPDQKHPTTGACYRDLCGQHDGKSKLQAIDHSEFDPADFIDRGID